eukprot:2688628-Rhodomonas_salina.1
MATRVGSLTCCSTPPSPSCPLQCRPNAHSSPSSVTTNECCRPQAIVRTPRPASVLIARGEVTALASSSLCPSCPCELLPQESVRGSASAVPSTL